ncbi:MAG: transposase domain-containing protein [Polaribacter sp.]
MLYFFFASCKANNINPYTWLKDVLNRLPEYKITKINDCFLITGKIQKNKYIKCRGGLPYAYNQMTPEIIKSITSNHHYLNAFNTIFNN